MRTSKLLGLVCAGFVALSLGAPHAGASTLPSPGGLGSPKQQPESPSVEQKNVNAPFSFLSLGSNNGDVQQSNQLGTSSGGDKGTQDGKQYGSVDNDHQCGCSQSEGPKHDGDKNRGDKDRGDKNRGDKDGYNCGCDQHGPKHKGDKDRGHKHHRGDKYQGNPRGNSCGCNNQGPKPDGNYGGNQYQGNPGGNSCGCNNQGQPGYQPDNKQGDQPTVKQVNVNAPVSILSIDANNGDVRQSNDAGSSSTWSGQGTEQKNVNAPVSILSFGANNGDVHQSNDIGSSTSSDCSCNQRGYGSGGGSSDGGSYGGGGNGNPLSAPTGGLPVVGSLLGGTQGGGSLLGL